MISWDENEIREAIVQLVTFNSKIHELVTENLLDAKRACHELNSFLKSLAPYIGDALLKLRMVRSKSRIMKKNKKGEISKEEYDQLVDRAKLCNNQETISCWINGNSFEVRLVDLQNFVVLMEMLKEEIRSNTISHFKILEIQNESITIFNRPIIAYFI